jgi:hypothetical protein
MIPDKKTPERAEEDKAEGKSPSTQAGEFVREEIEHMREGKHGARPWRSRGLDERRAFVTEKREDRFQKILVNPEEKWDNARNNCFHFIYYDGEFWAPDWASGRQDSAGVIRLIVITSN